MPLGSAEAVLGMRPVRDWSRPWTAVPGPARLETDALLHQTIGSARSDCDQLWSSGLLAAVRQALDTEGLTDVAEVAAR